MVHVCVGRAAVVLFLLYYPALRLLEPKASSLPRQHKPIGGFSAVPQEFIEGLGPLGPVAYTLLVGCFEMIPLFPTQPLSLASGLLFGAQKVREENVRTLYRNLPGCKDMGLARAELASTITVALCSLVTVGLRPAQSS